ncbi:hypothetical protein HY256_12820, partial [Candidatus Sumerlaeota bacterium]|nr:hypothetical protein [Candidatus Sumerlaeota bacterium]
PLIQAVSPIKLFEYLASGIPVVSVEWDALTGLRAPITVARNSEEFISGIRFAIHEKGRRDCAAFVTAHSWRKNLDLLMDRIASLRKNQ